METSQFALLIGFIVLVFIIWNLVISTKIVADLKKRNIKANIAHRRGIIFRYLNIYKNITIKETGKAGPLYYQFLITFILYIVLLFAGIVYVYNN